VQASGKTKAIGSFTLKVSHQAPESWRVLGFDE
jgi:hypothetical protein